MIDSKEILEFGWFPMGELVDPIRENTESLLPSATLYWKSKNQAFFDLQSNAEARSKVDAA